MNVIDITNQVIAMTGVDSEPAFAMKFVNEAMDILSNMYDNACIIDNFTSSITEINDDNSKRIKIPDGCVGIKRIELNGYKYTDFTADTSYIRVNDAGNYSIDYLRKPYSAMSEYEEPEINSVFHTPIVYYVAYKIGSNPENEQKFMAMSETANTRLSKMKKGSLRIKARLFR